MSHLVWNQGILTLRHTGMCCSIGSLFHKISLNMGPIFTKISLNMVCSCPKFLVVCMVKQPKIVKNGPFFTPPPGSLFLPKWPLKMGRGFETLAHPIQFKFEYSPGPETTWSYCKNGNNLFALKCLFLVPLALS